MHQDTREKKAGAPAPRALLDALDEGLVWLDAGKVAGCNAAFCRLVRLPAERLIGRDPAELFADPAGRPLALTAGLETARLVDARGELVEVRLRRADADTWIVADRSREARLEREVWRLTGESDGSAAVAGDHERACGTAMLEHEVRTATTVIRGYVRLLLDSPEPGVTGRQAEFLREIDRSASRASRLLDQLLALAAGTSGRALPISRKPCRLHDVLERAAATALPLLAARDLELELAFGLEDDAVQLDPDRFEQVVVNLLSNAARHAPRGTTVQLATELAEDDDGARACIFVVDSGPGVAVEDAERIFQPFVREAASGSGHGLGLTICRSIVEAHGGRIEAVPAAGQGLFTITLPVGG